jgi:hypothetical protein
MTRKRNQLPELTRELWTLYLENQEPLGLDERFPGRPDSDAFVLMSRIARALDAFSDDYHDTAVPQIIALVGGDLHSADYMAAARVKRAVLTLAPGMSHSQPLVNRMMAAWMDGWIAGALYGRETGWPPDDDDNDQGEEP